MKLINDEDIVCVLVGDGQEKMRLVQRTKREKISNVVFLDSVFKNEIPSLLADMDVLYIGWENNPLYRFGISPNKLIDYMLSGKPILHSVNAANDWVAELDCGVSVPAENPKAIVQGVEYLFSLNKDILLAKGGRGNEYAMKHFDYSILAKKFIENC